MVGGTPSPDPFPARGEGGLPFAWAEISTHGVEPNDCPHKKGRSILSRWMLGVHTVKVERSFRMPVVHAGYIKSPSNSRRFVANSH